LLCLDECGSSRWVLGVAKTAVCEKTLNDLVATLEKNQKEFVLDKDGPAPLVLPPEIRPEKMQEIVKEMDEALSSPGLVEDKQVSFTGKGGGLIGG
jgi:hypothetical protein